MASFKNHDFNNVVVTTHKRPVCFKKQLIVRTSGTGSHLLPFRILCTSQFISSISSVWHCLPPPINLVPTSPLFCTHTYNEGH